MQTHDYSHHHFGPGACGQRRWVPAMVLILIGAIFLLNNLHILPLHQFIQYWPAALIALGLLRLVESVNAHQRASGAILIFVGAVLLAGTLGFYRMSWATLWPLLLIGLGLMMLVRRVSMDSGWPAGAAPSPEWLHESAVFSGGKRKIVGDFKGGKLDCAFGGFEINLRQATIAADSAELEINAVFGGAEIKVPDDWEIVMRGSGVFGAFSDETTHPSPAAYPNPKRLIVKGSAVFGGVEVKN